MKTHPNESVSPIILPEMSQHDGSGLTKRELFAAMAMQGYIGCSDLDGHSKNNFPDDIIADWSVSVANALIKELNK